MKRLFCGFALVALAAGALAQAPARKPLAAAYDEYESSQRQRLRRESCGREEDMVGAFCVRQCERGYRPVSHDALPRRCRSVQPLPAGSLPQGVRRQVGTQPVPPAMSPAPPAGTPG